MKAMVIIARQSFWIMTRTQKSFNNSLMDAFKQFKSHGYEEKLKAQITSAAVPPARGYQDLLEFLYGVSHSGVPQIVCGSKYVSMHIT